MAEMFILQLSLQSAYLCFFFIDPGYITMEKGLLKS
jgi:hypothetical protein